MKKLIAVFVAVGAVIALPPVLKRRMAQKMREHCQQMASKCKQMMVGRSAEREEASGTPEHWNEMMAAHGAHEEPAATGEHSEQEAPQFVGHGEAVAV